MPEAHFVMTDEEVAGHTTAMMDWAQERGLEPLELFFLTKIVNSLLEDQMGIKRMDVDVKSDEEIQ